MKRRTKRASPRETQYYQTALSNLREFAERNDIQTIKFLCLAGIDVEYWLDRLHQIQTTHEQEETRKEASKAIIDIIGLKVSSNDIVRYNWRFSRSYLDECSGELQTTE